MHLATYFEGTSRLGSTRAGLPRASSIAYVCARCGEVWGRILVSPVEPDGVLGDPEPYHIVNRPCQFHAPVGVPDWAERHRAGLFQWWITEPESTSLMFHAALPKNFPESVLRREVRLMFEHYDRNHNAQSQSSQAA